MCFLQYLVFSCTTKEFPFGSWKEYLDCFNIWKNYSGGWRESETLLSFKRHLFSSTGVSANKDRHFLRKNNVSLIALEEWFSISAPQCWVIIFDHLKIALSLRFMRRTSNFSINSSACSWVTAVINVTDLFIKSIFIIEDWFLKPQSVIARPLLSQYVDMPH